jgi:hypothetical protein
VNSTLNIERGDLIIDGKNCTISSEANNINIKNFISGNTTGAQTFLKAKGSSYLKITDFRFHGMKLGLDLRECYFTKVNSVYFQAVNQAFIFRNAVNAFDMTNIKVHGIGIPSEIHDCIGGNISGFSRQIV